MPENTIEGKIPSYVNDPVPSEGQLDLNNVAFDELGVRWKIATQPNPPPPTQENIYTAAEGYLFESTDIIPVGMFDEITWQSHFVTGPVPITFNGPRIVLPKGYTYRVQAHLGIEKPLEDSSGNPTNAFYSFFHFWNVYEGGEPYAFSYDGVLSCHGEGTQEVHSRIETPAIGYISTPYEDAEIALEVYNDLYEAHIAGGSQMHVEVVEKLGEEPETTPEKLAANKAALKLKRKAESEKFKAKSLMKKRTKKLES